MKKGSNDSKKHLNENYVNQITILKSLSTPAIPGETKHLQINEIAEISGLRDEREVQRYLYILEGQKLVAPHPAGDFTSKTWCITKDGIKAISGISKAMVQ